MEPCPDCGSVHHASCSRKWTALLEYALGVADRWNEAMLEPCLLFNPCGVCPLDPDNSEHLCALPQGHDPDLHRCICGKEWSALALFGSGNVQRT